MSSATQFASLLPGIVSALTSVASSALANITLNAARGLNLNSTAINPAALIGAVGAVPHPLHPVMYPGMHVATGLAFIACYVLMIAATSIQIATYREWEAKGIRRTQQARLL